jgi:magnesium transporter
MPNDTRPRYERPVRDFIHQDFLTLDENWTSAKALDEVRRLGDELKIFYFYTVDSQRRLTGVVPVRRFLVAPPEKLLKDMAQRSLVTIRDDLPLVEAAKSFTHHKYLSLPVVDQEGCVVGVIDIKALTGFDVDLNDRLRLDEIFQTIGVRLESLGKQGLGNVFKGRFPWLLATVASGFVCAWLASHFAQALEKNILLSFFIALVLALGESVSIQSMTLGFQETHKPTSERRRFPLMLGREVLTGLMLGLPLGLGVGILAWVLNPQGFAAFVIAGSVALSILNAGVIGLSFPYLVNLLKAEPKIAAGPLVLAITDVATILVYLSGALFFLGS